MLNDKRISTIRHPVSKVGTFLLKLNVFCGQAGIYIGREL